jgi:hypothetical protein
MSCSADRLSDLPNDLLLRVLQFAPAKESASTTVLSRGWRSSLWCSSGAVNLETRIEDYRDLYCYGRHGDKVLFFS